MRIATQREAEQLTGLKVGGISALAFFGKPFTVYLNASATTLDMLYVSGGQRGLDLRLRVADLIAVTGATGWTRRKPARNRSSFPHGTREGRNGTMMDDGSFTAMLRAECAAIWEAQLAHPFLLALADGTLPPEVFQFFIVQDARYLTVLGQTYGYAAAKTNDRDRAKFIAERMINTVNAERALHERYAARFGMTPAQMAAVSLAPTQFYAYTSHLIRVGATGTLAETLTAMLPCAWIYSTVGQHFTAQGVSCPATIPIATGSSPTRRSSSRMWPPGCAV